MGVLSWRQIAIATVALPLAVALAVLAYAWPAARIAPRDLPVGVVSTRAAGQSAVQALEHAKPGGFDVHRYPDEASARSAIEHRDVYGAFVLAPGGVTVLEATAAGTAVAQVLDQSGRGLAAHAAQPGSPSDAASASTGRSPGAASTAQAAVRTVDVVPVSAHDPRGVVFSSSLLPLTICGINIALVITMTRSRMRRWRRVSGLIAACAAAALAAYLVAQGFLGALPHEHLATWAGLALTLLAIAAPAAGLVALVGPRGLGVGAVLMVFVGNPFSGSTSAPELLPTAAGDIGRWLPPGAGASLLRGTAYFGGSGSAGPVTVLVLWSVLGLAAVAFGRRSPLVAGAGPSAVGAGGEGEGDEAVSRLPATTPAGGSADRAARS